MLCCINRRDHYLFSIVHAGLVLPFGPGHGALVPQKWPKVLVQVGSTAGATVAVCTVLQPCALLSATGDEVDSMVYMLDATVVAQPGCEPVDCMKLHFHIRAVFAQTLAQLVLSHGVDVSTNFLHYCRTLSSATLKLLRHL